MQIVIELSENDYELACKWPDALIAVYAHAIKNGIVLPKGHGRLKDIDEIDWYGCTTEYDCPYKNRDCKDCDRAECSKTQVDSIPTIIPADKEEINPYEKCKTCGQNLESCCGCQEVLELEQKKRGDEE